MIRRLACILGALVFLALLMAGNQYTSSQVYGDDWWNGSWHYRVKISVNTSYFDRDDWPVEYPINFTGLLEDLNDTQEFDENSTRIVDSTSHAFPHI